MDMYEVKMRFPVSSQESGGPGRGQIYFSLDVFRSCSEFFPHVVVLPSQEIKSSSFPSNPVLRESHESLDASFWRFFRVHENKRAYCL